MFKVTALKLEEWSKTYPAKAELPRWIARLIRASCKGLKKINMPGGEHVHLAGFDGLVECDVGNEFVPPGISAWELSVDSNVGAKAEEDFDKRDQEPGHLNKAATSFVFATSRKWGNADDWARAKAASGWKDVRAIWSSHLEQWFERAPWVAAAFLDAALGQGCPGLESFGMVWSSYERIAAAAKLDPDFVVGDRTQEAAALLTWLESTPGGTSQLIRVSGTSHREVFHYVVACVYGQGAERREPWEALLFVVHTEDAARSLGDLHASHVAVVAAGPAVPHVIKAQDRSGCRVIIADTTPRDAVQPLPGTECIHLPPVAESTWIRSLRKLGFSLEDAASLCRTYGCDYERLRQAALLY